MAKQTPRIVMLGPQGAGKGTQAGRLARRLGIPHISTGDVLRHEMKIGSPLGKRITKTMNAGILIPDTYSNAVMKRRLDMRDAKRGWISDGYPRRMGQAKPFVKFGQPNVIILLELSDHAAIRRLSGRRVCSNGHVYHVRHNKPKKRAGYCDHDGLRLKQRDDDTPHAIRKRLHIYHHETEPMLHWLRKHYTIVHVDAHPGIPIVYRRMITRLQKIPWLASKLAPQRKR